MQIFINVQAVFVSVQLDALYDVLLFALLTGLNKNQISQTVAGNAPFYLNCWICLFTRSICCMISNVKCFCYIIYECLFDLGHLVVCTLQTKRYTEFEMKRQ